ncbi:MAG: hypothetical protein NC337_04475 [Roseburia sp.]|nr:hypothetical protein [Roseburia sp.]MCM1235560.1 hypothetical protein [Ruminococcus flavefaciens]
MERITVKQIHVGKPDASDEVVYSSLEEFCERIIVPPSFNLNNIVNGDKFYIVGNKGVGKTAILLYIKQLLTQEDRDALCSMIMFKRDYSNVEKAQLEKIQKELISNLDIDKNDLLYVHDFSSIWTLLIYTKIVNDNKNSDYKIFEKNTNWSAFESLITRLNITKEGILKLAVTIPKEVKTVYDSVQDMYISEERIEYPKNEDAIPLGEFYDAIKVADKLFQSLDMYNHKYFLCIDELEAYKSEKKVFLRDLAMIRDLIITAKRINELIRQGNAKNMKIVLSVRSEMIKSISNELSGKEINKCLDGFEEKIKWGQVQGQGIHQPLFYVWLKRIKIAAGYEDMEKFEKIYADWFPATIGIEDTVDFILKRTWYKPRDIVRFMALLEATAGIMDTSYRDQYFIQALDDYSQQGLAELVEEMGAIYSNKEIENINKSLIAFNRKKFTKTEFARYLAKNLNETDMADNIDSILDNLYRVGVIGCTNGEIERWNHCNDITPIEANGWSYIIHRGLWASLQLQRADYNGIFFIEIQGKPIECLVTDFLGKFLYLKFKWKGRVQQGKVHLKYVTGKYIEKPRSYINKKITLFVIGYDSQRQLWELSYDAYQGGTR